MSNSTSNLSNHNSKHSSHEKTTEDIIEHIMQNQISKDFKDLIEQYYNTKKDLLDKFQELKAIETSAKDYKKKYTNLLPKYEKVVSDLEKSDKKVKELHHEKHELKKELKKYKTKCTKLKHREQVLTSRIKKKIHDLHAEIDKRQAEIDNFNVYKEELAKYKKSYKLIYEKYEELREEFEKAISDKDYVFRDIGKKEEKISDIKSEVKSLKLKYAASKRKIDSLEKENKKLSKGTNKKELAKTAKIDELESELEFYKKEIERLEKEKNDLVNQITKKSEQDIYKSPEFVKLARSFDNEFELFSDSLPLGVVIVQGTDVKFSNKYFKKLVDSNKDNLFSMLDTSSSKVLKEQLKEQSKTSVELKIKRKKIFLEANIVETKYMGKEAKAILLRDVTYRKDPKKAKKDAQFLRKTIQDKEAEITHLEKKLHQTSKKLDSAVEEKSDLSKKLTKAVKLDAALLSTMIIITDRKGYVSSINNQITKHLGYRLNDFVDVEEDTEKGIDFIAADESEVNKIKSWIEEITKTRQPISGRLKVKSSEGDTFEYVTRMELILDVDSEPIGIVTILSKV